MWLCVWALGSEILSLRYWDWITRQGMISIDTVQLSRDWHVFQRLDCKINDHADADSIALLKKDATPAQLQLDALKHNSLPDIVSACQNMNQLTFMSSISARSDKPPQKSRPHISRPNIKVPKHWKNSKILGWRDSQLCQSQTVVEPEYCHAQVACQVMICSQCHLYGFTYCRRFKLNKTIQF